MQSYFVLLGLSGTARFPSGSCSCCLRKAEDIFPPGLPSVSQWKKLSFKSSVKKRLLWAAACYSGIPHVWRTESIVLVEFPLPVLLSYPSASEEGSDSQKQNGFLGLSTCYGRVLFTGAAQLTTSLILKRESQAHRNQKASLVVLFIVTASLWLLLLVCPVSLGGRKSLRLILEEE